MRSLLAPRSRTLPELLDEQAERVPDAVAAICSGREITYAELARRARRLAAFLRAHGVRRGDRVGLLLNNRAEFLDAAFGAGAAGATLVPFSTWSTRHELEFLLQDSGVRVLLTLPRFGKEEFLPGLGALLPESLQAPPGAWRRRTFRNCGT